MAKVSVVCPAYNRGYCIAETIQSILDQTLKDWELIIVDDGSTDDTRKIVKSFSDKRIKYFKIKHSGKIGLVRNYGTEKATSDIIVVQDSDDVSYPTRLDKIYKYFKANPKVEITYHPLVMVRNGEKNICGDGDFQRFKILYGFYLPGVCAYRKSAWEKYPYDETIEYGDDLPWHLHHCINGTVYGKMGEPLYEYRVRDDSDNDTGERDGRAEKVLDYVSNMLFEKYGLIVEYHITV